MERQSLESSSCLDTIKVTKICGEKTEESFKVKAIFYLEEDIVNELSKKLQEFLKLYSLTGGIMDIKKGTYEFELILSKENLKRTSASYIIEFLDMLKENYNVNIENNFDGLEITSEELEKLLTF